MPNVRNILKIVKVVEYTIVISEVAYVVGSRLGRKIWKR